MKRRFYLATVAALSAAAISSAYAVAYADRGDNDALAIAEAKISLTQAVTAAEQHVGGKASRAEYERHDGQWVFEVEVVKQAKVTDVTVDATNARILAAVDDKSDHRDRDDHEREKRD